MSRFRRIALASALAMQTSWFATQARAEPDAGAIAPYRLQVPELSLSSAAARRSPTRKKAAPSKAQHQWNRRAGLILSMGGGGALETELGGSFASTGSIGFYYRNMAFLLSAYLSGLSNSPGRGGVFLEAQFYRQIRRRALDTYWLAGIGLPLTEAQSPGLGLMAGAGVTLFGTHIPLIDGMAPYRWHPFLGLHLRAPLTLFFTPQGADFGAAGLLVLELAHQ